MKKQGFTLAEILISLMILGVIASLTVPSLIQNTTKKEQIVQLKKGLSMINQAITMNYALTSEDLSDFVNGTAETSGGNAGNSISTMLKSRLSVVKTDDGADTGYARTQDGLTYYWQKSTAKNGSCGTVGAEIGDGTGAVGNCYDIVISTKPVGTDSPTTFTAADANVPEKAAADKGGAAVMTGYYRFYAGADRVVPSTKTQEIMNAADPTKIKGGGEEDEEEGD